MSAAVTARSTGTNPKSIVSLLWPEVINTKKLKEPNLAPPEVASNPIWTSEDPEEQH